MLTKEQLQHIYKSAPSKLIDLFLPHLQNTFDEFEINTPQRKQMFLAQIGHESGELKWVKELASGKAYEGRLDLGNKAPGDGVRYKGRGLIQITGKHNYVLVSLALGIPCVETPELLETPENASRSAGWYWYKKNLNSLADAGRFELITRRINGGLNGYADRMKLLHRAREVM